MGHPNNLSKEDRSQLQQQGGWKHHAWQKIKEINKLALFRMCFPEDWVRDVVIPASNPEIEGEDMTLRELYVYLGCHFLMACFEGISGRRLWWSPKEVLIKVGAPFRLQPYMFLCRFTTITQVLRFTEK